MKAVLVILSLFFSVLSFAQNWENLTWSDYQSLMDEVSRSYDDEEYTLEMVYKTYKGRQLQTPFEVSPSYTQRSKSYDYSYLKGIVTIQNEKMKITIDSNNQMIAINNGAPRVSQEEMMGQYAQSKDFIETMKVKEENGGKTIEITYKKGAPVEKVQIDISRKRRIAEVIVFYASPVEYEDDDGNLKSDFVILKIEYKSFSNKHLYKEISLNEIIVDKKGSLSLSEGFKDFELVDLRIQN